MKRRNNSIEKTNDQVLTKVYEKQINKHEPTTTTELRALDLKQVHKDFGRVKNVFVLSFLSKTSTPQDQTIKNQLNDRIII